MATTPSPLIPSPSTFPSPIKASRTQALALLLSSMLSLPANIGPISVLVALASAILFIIPSFPPPLLPSLKTLQDLIKTSPALQSALIWIVPTTISLLTYTLYSMYTQLQSQFHKRFFRSVTIKNSDENYNTLLSYISKRCQIQTSSHVAETYKNKNKSWKDRMTEWRTGAATTAPKFVFRPSDDKSAVAFFNYKTHRIMMTRTAGTTVTVGWDRRPHEMETLTLTLWGQSSDPLLDLLQDALEDAKKEQTDELNVWVLGDSWMGGWEKALSKKPRSSDSVILDSSLTTNIIADAQRFQSSANWYMDRGIPYRRGYLLHGPPGTGKTSFVQVLAGELSLDMCMLNLADKDLNDTSLADALRETPKNSLIMIEDIDAIFVERKSTDSSRSAGVTFSGLLNALDGVASQEGRITIMTTNHIERLDPALIRPGRIDMKIHLDNATKSQAERMFLRFYPDHPKLAENFAAKIPTREISMAAMQGHLLANRDSPTNAVDTVHDLLDSKSKDRGDGDMPIYDHLRRVGLQHFAYAFQSFGFFTKSDFDTLTLDSIKSYIVDLRYDKKASARFAKLLEKAEDLMHDYVLADVPTIKDLLRAKFSHTASPAELCAILAPSGKGLCSVWQLKWLLQTCESYSDVLNYAPPIVAAVTNSPRSFMTAYDFCRREGSASFAACAYSLEENNFELARDFIDLADDDKLKEAGFGSLTGTARAATDTDETKKQHVKMKFALVDYLHAKREFELRYPECRDRAAKFARAITDEVGFGLVSLGQVNSHFAAHASGEKACEKAGNELVAVERSAKVEEEEEEEVKGWVVDWLVGDLKLYAGNFIEQECVTKEDIIGISDGDLSRVFKVEKLGHRKQLLRLIKGLEEGLAAEGGEEKKCSS